MDDLLDYEWTGQEMLGRDPERTLGDCPPWLSCSEPEPVADPSLPPTLSRFLSNNVGDQTPYAHLPIYVLGNNFIDGLTTIRVIENGIDSLATTQGTLLRRTILSDDFAEGTYAVTAYNGELARTTLTMTVAW